MKHEFGKKEGNQVTFNMTFDSAEFDKAVLTAYNKNKGKFNIPGFRKGKVPKQIIERQFGEGVFFEDAINELIPQGYPVALDELKLEPVDRPDFDVKEVGKGKDLVLEVSVTVRPEVKLGDYKGVEVEKVVVEVTDEDVAAELEKSREMNGRMVVVEDRAIQSGDTAQIDYKGFVGEEQFEGGTAENHALEIGSNSFIPGFEDQLIGANTGDEVEVNVTFPEEYHSENLAGKEAVFKVKVNSIKTKELPELDDEFAKDTSEFDTIDELKNDIKNHLLESAEKNAEAATRDKVIDAVIATMEADIPEVMIETEIDGMLRDLDHQLQYQGLNLQNFLQFSGQKIEDLREQMKTDAETRVKTSLVIEEIAKVEAVEVTEEDLNAEYEKFAEAQNSTVEEIKKFFTGENAEYLATSIKSRKAVDLLVENAKLV